MILPMFAMVVLTVAIGLAAFRTRVQSVKSGEVKIKSFRLMSDEHFPESVIKTSRNFSNQFEIPVLFYVVCTLYVALSIDSPVAEGLAWLFVGARVAHAYIHITYNNVMHRMLAFWASVLSMLALWITLLVIS